MTMTAPLRKPVSTRLRIEIFDTLDEVAKLTGQAKGDIIETSLALFMRYQPEEIAMMVVQFNMGRDLDPPPMPGGKGKRK